MTAYIDTSALLRLVLRERGALDEAVHLATALVWRERMASPLVVATHDTALAMAARTYGFEVRGA